MLSFPPSSQSLVAVPSSCRLVAPLRALWYVFFFGISWYQFVSFVCMFSVMYPFWTHFMTVVNVIENCDMRGRVIIYENLFSSAASAVRSYPRVPPSEEAEIFPLELH